MSGAAAGTLSFLVGGTQDAFRQAEPLLAAMGKRIIHCGPSGAGLAAKICNNLMLGVQQIATAEAMLLGQELGLDPGMSLPRNAGSSQCIDHSLCRALCSCARLRRQQLHRGVLGVECQ